VNQSEETNRAAVRVWMSIQNCAHLSRNFQSKIETNQSIRGGRLRPEVIQGLCPWTPLRDFFLCPQPSKSGYAPAVMYCNSAFYTVGFDNSFTTPSRFSRDCLCSTRSVAARPSDVGREHCRQWWTEGGVLRVQRLDVEERPWTESARRQPHQRTTVLRRFRSGRCLHVLRVCRQGAV